VGKEEVAVGNEERIIDGRRGILELPIYADFAFIKADKADELGNLMYRLAAQNFNPIMAMVAKTTIVEVEENGPGLDRPGKRDAPGDFRVPHRAIGLCRIDWGSVEIRSQGVRLLNCQRARMSTWVGEFRSLSRTICRQESRSTLHSENGILGMRRRAKRGEEDYDLVDAMKVLVTLVPGASFFHQADAHSMTRGGHLNGAALGGFQVSEKASWPTGKFPARKARVALEARLTSQRVLKR